jgi:hypothetical protein
VRCVGGELSSSIVGAAIVAVRSESECSLSEESGPTAQRWRRFVRWYTYAARRRAAVPHAPATTAYLSRVECRFAGCCCSDDLMEERGKLCINSRVADVMVQ